VGAVWIGVLQPLVQSLLGVLEGVLDRHTQRAKARRADGDEERRLGLDPSRQVPKPGPNEIGTGHWRVGRGHDGKLRAWAATWQAAVLCARPVAARLLEPAGSSEIAGARQTGLNTTCR
jgi:hypothetical protein